MRVLLDECIDEALRHHITGHDCRTCRYTGLKGMTNGKLLAAAERLGFEVLITVDRNMQYQQRLSDREIALEERTTNLDDLLPLVPDVLAALEVLKPGDVVRVHRIPGQIDLAGPRYGAAVNKDLPENLRSASGASTPVSSSRLNPTFPANPSLNRTKRR